MKKENKALAKQKKAKQRRRANAAKMVKKVCLIALPILIVAGIIGLIVYGEVRGKLDYSAGITEDGRIAGIKLSDYVQLGDYSSITAKREELVSDELVEERIAETLKEKATLNAESTRLTKDGDEVSIDFVGTIDGEAFENGTATDYAVEIGSDTMIDGFEEGLIGRKVGDTFTIDVTFPEDYSQDEDLQGQDAQFEITVKGIYEAPELTDDYVKTTFPEAGETVAAYKKYVEETIYRENLMQVAQDALMESSEITVPENYYKHLKNTFRAGYEKEYNYYNQFYYSYVGYYMWDDVYSYYGMTKEEFQENLEEAVNGSAEFYLAMEALFDAEGLSLSEEEVEAYIQAEGYSNIEDAYEEFGRGYWWQNALADKALGALADKVIVK